MILVSVIAACLLATVLAVAVAFFLDGKVLFRVGEGLAGVSTGLLLALSCTHLIPEAFEHAENPHGVGLALWSAVFILVLLQQGLESVHGHRHGENPRPRGVWPIVLGESLHTFTDGIVIAGSFLVSPSLGWAIAAGILLHEMPQEIGDFVLIRHQGLSREQAFRVLALSGASAVAGGVLGLYVMDAVRELLPYALAVSGASFLFIALCELIPRLAERITGRGDLVRQALFLAIGAAAAFLIEHGH